MLKSSVQRTHAYHMQTTEKREKTFFSSYVMIAREREGGGGGLHGDVCVMTGPLKSAGFHSFVYEGSIAEKGKI